VILTKKIILPILIIVLTITFVPLTVLAGGKPFHTDLSGAEEVPGPGDPDGSGTAHLTFNQGQGEICYSIHVEDITLPAIGAHIHHAEAGFSGPVVVPLTSPDETGHSEGCVEVDKELVKEIRQNSEEYYVNVHNAIYPAGAVRGQL
jgi:hypothetical protein